MRWPRSFLPLSITAQITLLVTAAILLGHLVTAGLFLRHLGPFARITAIALMSLFIVLASLYAVRWITAPLSFIASAARAFGRAPAEGGTLRENGPRDIAQVARAMNDMRNRIRALIDERTRMLAAISHDLRTPLTRLRLRVERLPDAEMQHEMLHDIGIINDMLRDTLTYLRDGGRSESVQRIGLPSLLQTICAEFTDVGHSVTYEGPNRFVFACKPRALTRAVTNIVENAVRYGTSVSVRLRTLSASEDQVFSAAQIEVCDDGPGMEPSVRERAFEPFFKGDAARASSAHGGGFGLGLSIARDVVNDHGGQIELLDREPHGLIVRLTLPLPHRPTESPPLADTFLNIT